MEARRQAPARVLNGMISKFPPPGPPRRPSPPAPQALRRLEADMFDQRRPDAFLRAVTTETSL